MVNIDGNGFVDPEGAFAYNRFRHGPDGALLLDPVFTGQMEKYCPGENVVDVGCGTAPWSIFAANIGAVAVYAIDNSYPMLSQATSALDASTGLRPGIVTAEFADALEIPKPNESFGVALSINVGCVLPSSTKIDRVKTQPLLRHLQEMARVLKPGGMAIVTAPASLETPFTTFGDEEDKISNLENDLDRLGEANEAEMRKLVGANDDILRATIIQQDRCWKLIKEAGSFSIGQSIKRRIPGLIVPNYNHPADEYEHSIELAGFQTIDTARLRLPDDQYTIETGLGKMYTTNNPFVIYLLQKQAA